MKGKPALEASRAATLVVHSAAGLAAGHREATRLLRAAEGLCRTASALLAASGLLPPPPASDRPTPAADVPRWRQRQRNRGNMTEEAGNTALNDQQATNDGIGKHTEYEELVAKPPDQVEEEDMPRWMAVDAVGEAPPSCLPSASASVPAPAYLVGDFVLVSEDVDKEIMGLRSASCLVESCSSSPPWVYTVQVPRDRITTGSFMSPYCQGQGKGHPSCYAAEAFYTEPEQDQDEGQTGLS